MKQQFEKIDSNGKWVQNFFKKVNGTKRKMLLFPFSISLLELDIRFQPIFDSTEEIRLTKIRALFSKFKSYIQSRFTQLLNKKWLHTNVQTIIFLSKIVFIPSWVDILLLHDKFEKKNALLLISRVHRKMNCTYRINKWPADVRHASRALKSKYVLRKLGRNGELGYQVQY